MEDFYSDSGHLFAKLLTEVELPEFVKEGMELPLEKLGTLNDLCFADPIARLLPINDRANTYISAAYAYGQPHEKQAALALEAIEKQAALFGIAQEVADLKGLLDHQEPEQKVALDSSEKPFRVEVGGCSIEYISGSGAKQACQAGEFFVENLHEIPFEKRMKVASDLADAIAENGAEPQEDLLKIAGRADCDEEIFNQQVMLRLGLVFDTLEKNAVLKPLELTDPEERRVALQEIDARHKLARFHGVNLLDPHRAVYNTIKKEAELLKIGSLRTVPLTKWHGSPDLYGQAVEHALGKEKAAELIDPQTKAPDLGKFAALEAADAELIHRYLP